MPDETALTDAIADAARKAIVELFAARPNESFYYVSLVTTGEGLPPYLTAWSEEALRQAAQESGEEESVLRWSHADSPYHLFGAEHFGEVVRLFAARPQPPLDDIDGWMREVSARRAAMERAMRRLDSEGLFGAGAARLQIVINAEVTPPDASNVEVALRLNPREALGVWLEEAAELD